MVSGERLCLIVMLTLGWELIRSVDDNILGVTPSRAPGVARSGSGRSVHLTKLDGCEHLA